MIDVKDCNVPTIASTMYALDNIMHLALRYAFDCVGLEFPPYINMSESKPSLKTCVITRKR